MCVCVCVCVPCVYKRACLVCASVCVGEAILPPFPSSPLWISHGHSKDCTHRSLGEVEIPDADLEKRQRRKGHVEGELEGELEKECVCVGKAEGNSKRISVSSDCSNERRSGFTAAERNPKKRRKEKEREREREGQ